MDEYELHPLEQVNAFEEIDRLSLELLGVYHSHPHHPCYPSELDKLQAFYPDTAFFIISLADFHNPQIKAFKIHKGKVMEEKIIFD
jgi:proteasome lid subunit RPN8/RPN11